MLACWLMIEPRCEGEGPNISELVVPRALSEIDGLEEGLTDLSKIEPSRPISNFMSLMIALTFSFLSISSALLLSSPKGTWSS